MISGSPYVTSNDHIGAKKTHKTQGINLMEPKSASKASSASGIPDHAAWFTNARFGMFVHYGLWSMKGASEWQMFRDNIPPEEYNRATEHFRAEAFDARALVDLAKRAGAGYVVFNARHHDGFCLWNTKTTAFNSMNTPACRDLIREYVAACREAGLRVGIYYSIMSWQFPAMFRGPYEDPSGWEAMVTETREQVRELMTNYGHIDVLWYDGCVVPGCGEDSIRAEKWRTRELNAMVRQLQPAILINDRSALPEDFDTPEQHLTPADEGRLWECCQTMGDSWGWRPGDVYKDAGELIRQLIFCARFGGNFLLNIGPRGDGSIDSEQAARMEAIGRWMAVNGESILGTKRTTYAAAEHILGSVTVRDNFLYFHITTWPDPPARIAGIKVPICSIRLLATGQELKYQQSADGTVTLMGLPIKPVDPHVTVIAIELDRPLGNIHPPALLTQRDTGRTAPAEAQVHEISGWDWSTAQQLEFSVSVKGRYVLELGIIGKQATEFFVRLDGREQRGSFHLPCANYPDTLQIKRLVLEPGRHCLEIHSANGAEFGLYLWRLQPKWYILAPPLWRVIGPFPTQFRVLEAEGTVRQALQTAYPPETEPYASAATYPGVDFEPVCWLPISGEDSIIFATACGDRKNGICYARTIIRSPEERAAEILVACDWWANVFVNRELVTSERNAKEVAPSGAWFSGWKPSPATIRLRKGANELLVKCHPGSTNNWFNFHLNNPGDLKIRS